MGQETHPLKDQPGQQNGKRKERQVKPRGFPMGTDDTQTPILHVDMDSFYASVEVAEDPALAGLPVIVGGRSARGVVTAATYEARAFGVKAGMPSARARALCPQAVFLPGRRDLYLEYSRGVLAVLETITPQVEQISIDESFLDVAGAVKRLGSPIQIARQLRARIRREVGLPASVGIANSKTVAKIASDKAKPDGIFLVPNDRTVDFLHSLPVSALPGVGVQTEVALTNWGMQSVRQLAETSRPDLVRLVGEASAHRLLRLAWGKDRSAVGPREREKSISTERTFEQNISDHEELRRHILDAAHQCAYRLRKADMVAWTVTLKLKDKNFVTRTRSRTLVVPTDVGRQIAETAWELLAAQKVPSGGVRLLGVGTSSLVAKDDGVAIPLDHDPRAGAAEEVMDRVRSRFGDGTLRPASLLPEERD